MGRVNNGFNARNWIRLERSPLRNCKKRVGAQKKGW